MTAINIEMRPTGSIKLNPHNARTHSKKQIKQIANSIEAFGNVCPLLIDEHLMLIAGHGRLAAAQSLNIPEVPTIVVRGLTSEKRNALMLADNKIASNAGWDRQKLQVELGALMNIEGLDISVTGFEPPEIDQLFADFEQNSADPADQYPVVQAKAVSRTGDLWVLGNHRLLCGDARSHADVKRVCDDDAVTMAFLDPPYNVRVADIVGRGRTKHAEFAMGSGEMSNDEFREFLRQTLSNAADVSIDGAVHYVCMDWKHLNDLLTVGETVYEDLLNIIAWVKSNGGQGSFYRSQHEMIAAYRVGSGGHLNNVELGKHGRNRTNVWQYAGVNAFGKNRLKDLRAHPTVKPVAMVADAIKDCTRRDDIVLDTFAGSGTTMLACERVGRKARMIEYQPCYVDLAVRRWQDFTRRDALSLETGEVFDKIAGDRQHD